MSMNALQLRHEPEIAKKVFANYERFPITVVLDNIYDTFNIGAAFRVADAFNACKVVITGKDSKTPPEKQIRKSSIHICDYFLWEYHENIEEYFDNKNGLIIAIEKTHDSVNYRNEFERMFKKHQSKMCYLIVGNETHGVNKKILEIADSIVEIPMYGVDHSMNVINALAIVGHELAYRIKF